MTVWTYDDLAGAVHATRPRLGDVRLVTVDGPSGSGKTTFAGRLVTALAGHGSVGLVEIEALYEGWTLDGAWSRLHEMVLEPLAAGRAGGFHPYDWVDFRWSADWCSVPLHQVIVVEGCGCAPRAADPLTSHRIWVEAPYDLALARGLARDGIDLDRHLRRWKRLEADHFAAEDTRRRADLRVDGAPAALLLHDSELTFSSLP